MQSRYGERQICGIFVWTATGLDVSVLITGRSGIRENTDQTLIFESANLEITPGLAKATAMPPQNYTVSPPRPITNDLPARPVENLPHYARQEFARRYE